MAYSYEDIMAAQAERITAARAQAVADLQAARTSEDSDGTHSAAYRVLELDKTEEALARRYHQHVATQQAAPKGNRFGLNSDEVAIARGMFSGDRSMTDDERDQVYAQNKQKLQHQRATGQYRDDQGSVRR